MVHISNPFSLRSLFHGLSLLVVVAVCLSCWVLLWQMNYRSAYQGRSSCFQGNAIGMYGLDNFLYCPPTKIVSNVNVSTVAYAGVYSQWITQDPKTIPLQSVTTTGATNIDLDDDDEGNSWWFNMNPGSSVSLHFSNLNPNLSFFMEMDDEDVDFVVANDSTFTLLVDQVKGDAPSRAYKLSVLSSTSDLHEQNSFGHVNFTFVQTQYAHAPLEDGTSCLNTLNGCLYESFDADFNCVLLVNDYPSRDFSPDITPFCTEVIQSARDQYWSRLLIPLSCLIVFLVAGVNVAVTLVANKLELRSKLRYKDISDLPAQFS